MRRLLSLSFLIAILLVALPLWAKSENADNADHTDNPNKPEKIVGPVEEIIEELIAEPVSEPIEVIAEEVVPEQEPELIPEPPVPSEVEEEQEIIPEVTEEAGEVILEVVQEEVVEEVGVVEEVVEEEAPEVVEVVEVTSLPGSFDDWRALDDPAFEIDFKSFSNEAVLAPVAISGGNVPFVAVPAIRNLEELEIKKQEVDEGLISSIANFFRDIFSTKKALAEVPVIQAIVVNAVGGPEDSIVPQVAVIDGKTVIKMGKNGNIRPGAYTLIVSYEMGGQMQLISRDFTWGVLAINTNKATYTLGDEAYLQMAALTKFGHTLCDANLKLEIRIDRFFGAGEVFATSDASITRNETCGANNYTESPDYSAYFIPSELGTYTMTLTNLDTGYSITDKFEVADPTSPDGLRGASIERISTSRTNPFLERPYTMRIKVTVNESFEGTITETIPEGFVSSDPLTWQVNLAAGESTELSYTYDPPNVSPELYEHGPLKLKTQNAKLKTEEVILTEARAWLIASDADITWDGGGSTANWSEDANWSGDVEPTATDNVIFDGTSVKAATIDASFPGHVASTTVTSGYTGIITMDNFFVVSGNLDLMGGALQTDQAASSTIYVGGTMTMGSSTVTVQYSSLTSEGTGQTITAGNLRVSNRGIIEADSEGFTTAVKGPGGGSGTNEGGTHGGVGSRATTSPYGSFTNPVSLGSAGVNTAGGGAITFNISGTFTNNGTTTATGAGSSTGSGECGSGGSINITASTFAGMGTTSANGGECTAGAGGSGGGGRISLNGVTTDTFTGSLEVKGGASRSPGHAGTIYLNSTKRTALTLGGAGNLTSLRLGSDGTNDYTFTTITVNSGGTLEVDGNPLMNAGNGGAATINATTITVNAGGVISADGMGFTGQSEVSGQAGPGFGGGTNDAGTYGGMGSTNATSTYGSFTNPTNLGSGGNDSDGGGAIILNVSGTFTLNGTTTATGAGSSTGSGECGSGGSINITASTFAGMGTTSANGGECTAGAGGSGGGGRISLNGVTTDTFTGSLEVKGGASRSPGHAGTIYLNSTKRTALTLGGAGNLTSLRLGSDGTNDYTFTTITVNSGGTLEVDGNPLMNAGNGGAATINATTITVNAGGVISADGLGFAAGGEVFAATGPGYDGTATDAVVGGTYGGQGGSSATSTYGSFTNPINLGSGGGTYIGAGAVILNVSGTFTNNGTTTASGISPTGSGYCGSGGSINITAATFAGIGTTSASGVNCSFGSPDRSGGGGRISVKQTSGTSLSQTVQAFGGSARNTGAAGTIYLESPADGTNLGQLTINNNNTLVAAGINTVATTTTTGHSVGTLRLENAGKLLIGPVGTSFTLTGTTSTTTIAIQATSTLYNNGQLTVGGTSVVTLGGWINGTGSTVTWTGVSGDTGVTIATSTYSNLVFNNAGTVFSSSALTTATAALTITAGTFDIGANALTLTSATYSNNDTLRLIGSQTLTGFTNDTDSGTTTYNGTGSYTGLPTGSRHYTLLFEGTGTYTLSTPLYASSSVTISAGTLDVSASSYDFALDGNFRVDAGATFTARSGTTTFTSASAQSASSSNFYNLNHTGAGTLTINGTTTISGNLTNAGPLTVSNAALSIAGNLTNTSTINFGTKTTTFNGSDTQVLSPGGAVFSSIDMSGSGTLLLSEALNASSSVTISSGTFDVSSSNYPLTLDGDFTVAAGATFTARSGTTTFSSASAQSASSSNFYNLAHTGAGTLTINGTTTLSGTLINSAGTFDANYKRVAVTGPTNIAGGTYLARTSMSLLAGGLTVSGGTFTGSSGDVDVNDNLVLSSGTLTAPSGSFTVSGNWTKSGGTFTPGTGTTTFDGSGTQTITPDSSAFYNLAYEGSGTLSSAAALNASSSVTISSGTFDVSASNYPLILDGNFTVAAGATFTARSGTTTFSGSSAQTGSSTNYYNLYHQGSGTLTVSGTTTVSGNLTTDATVTRITSAMTLSGTSTNAGTILQVSPGRIIKPALSITLDKSAYDTSVDTSLTITLIDNDENVVGTTTDTTTITLTDGTDTETVTLTESGNQTFTFSGSITLDQTTVVVGDGTFQVAADGTITASYTDNEDPTDNLQTDMATVSVPATPTPTPTPESSPSTGGGGGILGMFGVVNSIPNLVTENVIEPIKEIAQEVVSVPVSFVRDLFGDEETPPPAESVTKESPLSLRDIWNLLPVEQINTFVFSPLPQSLALLSDQFPEFETTFEKLGVERMTDLDRLLGSNFVLPRIENIEEIPNEVVLTLHGVETEGIKTPRLLSFATFLDISKSGAITQRVNAISGQKLTFAVRPEHKAISVTGYIVLKESRFSDTNPNDLSFPVSSLAAGVILSGQEQGIVTDKLPKIEERLLLDKFTYQDPDGDGVYTAEVNAPMVASDFEVITVIDYEDPKLGNKELRFALVVDPEGYVYANVNGGQLRIEKAKVSIFVKDPQGRYILWPSEEFQQRNPQVTGTTGEYSFLVPTGEYYMSIEAKGYETYQGASFVVTEGSGVHENIELLPDNNLLQKFGWPWLLVMLVLLVILLLLAYNFYKDKQRTY